MDPCEGHECDSCKSCLGGRCCRNDNPGYRLPEVGEITPFYGELGVRNDMGDKVECHVCGAWYVSVSSHAWVAHDLNAKEYKAAFGLTNKGLISEDYHQRMSNLRKQSYKGWMPPGTVTPEQRRYRRRSLEGTQRAREVAYESLIPAGHSASAFQKMRATKAKQSEAYAEERHCAHCGKPFVVQAWLPNTVCSAECRHARAIAVGRERMAARIAAGTAPEPPQMTEDIKAKIGAKAAARWAEAGDEERQASAGRLRRYIESIGPKGAQAQRLAANRAATAKSRKPHYCTAGCGTLIPNATPLTCSPECRRKVRVETAANANRKRWESSRSPQ